MPFYTASLDHAPVLEDTHTRLARLEAIQDIHELRQRYAQAADDKYLVQGGRKQGAALENAVRAQLACFTHDALWRGGPFGGDIIGEQALLAFFSRSPWLFTFHSYANIELRVNGEGGEGKWRLVEIGVRESDGVTLLLTGRTSETYRKVAGRGWLISGFAFDHLHSLELSHDPQALRCLIPSGENV